MNGIVSIFEDMLKWCYVNVVDLTKPLSKKAEKLLIGPLVGAAVKNHMTQFSFLTWLRLHLHYFVV